MKEFLKYVFATVCGILIVGMALSILFIITLAGMAAAGSSSTKVQDNSVFVLSLNGSVQERGEEANPLSFLLNSADMSEINLKMIYLQYLL